MSNCSQVVKRCFTSFCHFSPHKIVFALISIPRFRPPRRIIRSRCLRRIDQDAFNHDLVHADWGAVFAAPTVTVKWERFLDLFIPIIDKHAPVRTVRIRNARAPPVSDDTKLLMSRRRAALAVGCHGSADYKSLNRAVDQL